MLPTFPGLKNTLDVPNLKSSSFIPRAWNSAYKLKQAKLVTQQTQARRLGGSE